MAQSWFYRHGGKIHGPVSSEEIKRLARNRLIDAQDLVWPDDAVPAEAIPASAALDLAGLAPLPGATPDWLADVAAMQRKGPIAPPTATDAIPEWFEDLRLWYGLELFVDAKRTGTPQKTKVVRTASTPTQIGPIPDWLKTWMTPKKSATPTKKRPAAKPSQLAPSADAAQAQAPAVPPGDAGSKPTIPVAALGQVDTSSIRTPPLASPAPSLPPSPPALAVPLPEPESKIVPVPANEPRPTSSKSAEAEAQPLPPAEPPESTPPVPSSTVPSASEVTSAAVDPVDLLATKALEETGLDLLTGEVLDPDKFQTWKQQNARPAAPGQATDGAVSPFEIFRKGRIAVERWVDDDNNRSWIMSAAGDEVKTNPEVLALLREHADAGTEIHDKLLGHLEFLVENRRQYYLAMGDKSI
jgi:hypothetical protein